MEWFYENFAPGPVFLWMALAFLLLAPAIWVGNRLRRRPTVRFSSAEVLRRLTPSIASRTHWVLPVLRTLAILALIVALLRPQSGGEYRALNEGIAIQMVLDVSGSMAEQDFVLDARRVRRMDAVKDVFQDFVLGAGGLSGRDGDLIGLTKFAMYADTVSPLTLDHASLKDLVTATDIPGWIDGQQVREEAEAGYTALGDAVVEGTDVLRRAGEQAVAGVPGAEAAKNRIMILLTDGANNPAPLRSAAAPNPVEAARVAATLGIKIYTIGAVPNSPQRQQGFLLFAPRRAEYDEGLLRQIADVTGGKYFRATDAQSLKTIYEEIDRLEKRKTGERHFQDNIFAATLAMSIGLGLLFAELLLANTRYRRIP
jgi:Ca-activated chloride channel family protein